MPSSSQNLKIDDVNPNLLHTLLLLIIYIIIRTYPALRPYVLQTAALFVLIFICIFSNSIIIFLATLVVTLISTAIDLAIRKRMLKFRSSWFNVGLCICMFVGFTILALALFIDATTNDNRNYNTVLNILSFTYVMTLPWITLLSQKAIIFKKNSITDNPNDAEILFFSKTILEITEKLEVISLHNAYAKEVLTDLRELLKISSKLSSKEIHKLTELFFTLSDKIKIQDFQAAKLALSSNKSYKKINSRLMNAQRLLENNIARRHGWLERNLLALIHAYRNILPPQARRSCRYSPTCSEYAERAILIYGPFKGIWLSLIRSASCVPHGGMGWDPPENYDA